MREPYKPCLCAVGGKGRPATIKPILFSGLDSHVRVQRGEVVLVVILGLLDAARESSADDRRRVRVHRLSTRRVIGRRWSSIQRLRHANTIDILWGGALLQAIVGNAFTYNAERKKLPKTKKRIRNTNDTK